MKKNYTLSFSASKFWTFILPLAVLAVMAGGLLGLLLVDKMVMPNLPGFSDRGVISVPDVRNMDWEEARQKNFDVGLVLRVRDRVYHDSLESGVVISQLPEPGTHVKRGRHVFAVVSNGHEVSVVPELSMMTERQARSELGNAGFVNVTVIKRHHEKVEKDRVVSVEPGTGVAVSREYPVTLTLSLGPKPTHSVVPNIIGEMYSDALVKIEENGFKPGRISHRSSGGARPGSVVSQSVSPGTRLPFDTSIDIVVASGE